MSAVMLPQDALSAAAEAVSRASALGHDVQVERWRELSRGKMFGTTCANCLQGVFLIAGTGAGSWVAGGQCLHESCLGPAPEAA
jgi:hypothetical protein